MRLEFFDLLFETLPMGSVLRCVDRLSFESGVLSPQCVDLATKAIVFGFDVFVFAHVTIVARCKPPAATPSRFVLSLS